MQTEQLTEQLTEQGLTARQHFEKELAEISFQELQKHFAKGILIKVASHLDVVEVALQIHADNADQIQQWMDNQDIARAHDEHAKVWLEKRSMLMAVTVAPWVLVQDIN